MKSHLLMKDIAFGGDYNPEQWPEEVWAKDVKLMRQAGVNLVTVGVFSWAKLQPTEHRFDFGWLDRVLDLLNQYRIKVCLATATASPPPWLTLRYPEVRPLTADGVRLQVGSRQHYSPSSSAYRRFATQLVTRLAKRFGRHPSLVSWHINNEYAAHVSECHGKESTQAFRAWLKSKYQTVDALNDAWGTAFWSQSYGRWAEIFTPSRTPYAQNPAQSLDFKRFMSDAYLEIYQMEERILRKITPEVPITTNFMGFFKSLDYRKWAERMNFVSWDSYPDPLDEVSARRTAAAGHDLMRSLKPDRPFVLMEQSSSNVNWRPMNAIKRPGLMRLWSMQALARGSDALLYFQWRVSRAGAEKFHSGIVPHIPVAKSRIFAEVAALGAEVKKLRPIVGSILRNRVAIAFDWNAWWGVELDSKLARMDYAELVQEIHAWFYGQNIVVDFVHPGSSMSGYTVVIAPALYLLEEAHAKNLKKYVADGGKLVATYFTGVVDESERIVPGGAPGYLRELFGIRVEEWVPYPAGKTNQVRFIQGGGVHKCDRWCDILHLEGSECIASYGKDFFADRPAVTRNLYGKGAAYYLATHLDEFGMARFFGQVLQEAKYDGPLKAPAGIEVTERTSVEGKFLFLLNHNDRVGRVSLGRLRGQDLLSGRMVSGSLRLDPLGVAVLQLACG